MYNFKIVPIIFKFIYLKKKDFWAFFSNVLSNAKDTMKRMS